MATIGEDLRRERNRHGWSLKDVEQVLHIRSAYLEAIETENFGLIPGHVFAKGFIRNYANLLGLDGQVYVNRYKDLIGEDIVVKIRPSQRVKIKSDSKKKEKELIPPEPQPRLTYEGRRRHRQKTLAQERIAAGVVIIVAIILFVWLFLF